MRTRNIVLLIVGLVGVLLFLGVGLVVAVGYYAYRQMQLTPITVAVTEPDALRETVFVDDRINCRVKFPKDFQVSTSAINGHDALDAVGNPGLVRVYSVPRPGANLNVLSRATIQAMHVQFQKDGGTHTETAMQHSTTIDGKPAVYAEITWVHMGEPMRCMVAIIDEGASRWYMVLGACQEMEWFRLKPVFESSLATFELGTGGTRATNIAQFNRGDRVAAPSVPATPSGPAQPIAGNVKPTTPAKPPQVIPPAAPKPDAVDQALASIGTDGENMALYRLGRMKPIDARRAEVIGAMVKILGRKQNTEAAIGAGHVLGAWIDRESVPLILPFADSDDSNVRRGAILAFGGVKDARAASVVAKSLGREGHEGNEAFGSLRKMGNIAEDALIDVLKNGNRQAQFPAAKLLGEFGTKDAVEPLREATKSKEFFLRVDASNALKKLEARLDKVAE